MTKHRSPDERANQILTAARDCFLENGYFATRMDEIADESGLSKGGIYFHFDSKRDIFRSLVEREYEEAMAFIEQVIHDDGDIADMLGDIGRHFAERFASTDAPRFMAIIVEMGQRDEEIREMLLELQQSYIERISAILRQGMKDGQLQEFDPESGAVLLKAIIDGLQASYGIGYEPDLDNFVPTSMQILGQGMLDAEE